jgi:hypothetical protein
MAITASFAGTKSSIESSLAAAGGSLTATQAELASTTIRQVMSIWEKFDAIASLEDEGSRTKEINKLTLGSSEPGFCPSVSSLKEKIESFIATYEKAKAQGVLPDFFGCFSKGDRCLNGRFESMYRFGASLEGINIETMSDPTQKLIYPSTALSAFIENEFGEGCSLTDLKAHLTDDEALNRLALTFKAYEKADKKMITPFFDMLLEEGLIATIPDVHETIDWKSVVTSLKDSAFFGAIHSTALTYII